MPISHERMDTVTTAKFLGVTIDCYLTFQSHVTERITKARKLAYVLVRLKRVGIPTEDLIEIYRARILSLLTYAAPTGFTHISQTLITNLERVQNLKIIVPGEEGYEDRLHVAKVTTVEAHICKSFVKTTPRKSSKTQNTNYTIWYHTNRKPQGKRGKHTVFATAQAYVVILHSHVSIA